MTSTVVLAQQIPTLTCPPPEGTLRITLAAGGHGWIYKWTKEEISLVKEQDFRKEPLKVPDPAKRYGGIGKWKEGKTGMDQHILGPDSRLDAPYAVSPNGSWLISSVYPTQGLSALSSQKRLALIHRDDKRVNQLIDLPYDVEALSWSPSGRTFAIFLTENITRDLPWSLRRWFAKLIGHPISYYKVRVVFYDLEGKEICEQVFRDQLAYGGGYIEWLPK